MTLCTLITRVTFRPACSRAYSTRPSHPFADYVVFLAAVGLTIYSFVQAVSSWDQVKEIKKESSDGILILPDLYMVRFKTFQTAASAGRLRLLTQT